MAHIRPDSPSTHCVPGGAESKDEDLAVAGQGGEGEGRECSEEGAEAKGAGGSSATQA